MGVNCSGTKTTKISQNSQSKKQSNLNQNLSYNSWRKSSLATSSFENIEKFYTFDKPLGEGAFGVVRIGYSKHDPSKKYAIKTIDKSQMKDHAIFLANEINILKKIDHPNIIKFYEAYQDDLNIYLVQEICDGGNLQDMLNQSPGGKFTQQQAAQYVLQLLQAIHYLHEKGIVHRDLKLENLMLQKRTGQEHILKVIDFGLSCNTKQPICQQQQQHMHSVVGTPLYMAPEVLKGDYNHKCDFWSTGVILFQMLTGRYPFQSVQGQSLQKVLQKKVRLGEGWGKEAEDIVAKLLKVNPRYRIQYDKCIKHPFFKQALQNQKSYYDNNIKKVDSKILENLQAFSKQSRFSSIVLKITLFNFVDQDELKKLQNIFYLLDKNNEGYIDEQDMISFLQQNNYPEEKIEHIFQELCEEGEKKIKYQQFLKATLDTKYIKDPQKIQEIFNYFDTDKSGYLTVKNIKEIFARGGYNIPVKEIKEMIKVYYMLQFQEVDIENNNKISFEEFKMILLYDVEQDQNAKKQQFLTMQKTRSKHIEEKNQKQTKNIQLKDEQK